MKSSASRKPAGIVTLRYRVGGPWNNVSVWTSSPCTAASSAANPSHIDDTSPCPNPHRFQSFDSEPSFGLTGVKSFATNVASRERGLPTP